MKLHERVGGLLATGQKTVAATRCNNESNSPLRYNLESNSGSWENAHTGQLLSKKLDYIKSASAESGSGKHSEEAVIFSKKEGRKRDFSFFNFDLDFLGHFARVSRPGFSLGTRWAVLCAMYVVWFAHSNYEFSLKMAKVAVFTSTPRIVRDSHELFAIG